MGCAGVGVPFVHLELVGRGGLGRRLLDGLRELEVVVVLQYSFKKVSTTTWCERHRSQFAAGPFYSSVKRFVASPALAITTSALCPITLTAQVVGILIVKEGLIVAFIVDAFLSQFEDNRALCEDENIASLDQSRAGEGFRIIASKRSSKDDIYRAMFLEDDD